ncbi:MAG TPA: SAM-dependent methyltransferase [Thermoplasmata archaeon]|nr:SAM-dependent methyltransferase [Thermoplasmata archaeon]
MAHAPPPLDPAALARSRALLDRLRRAAASDGFLPFDRYMEIVLYAHEIGYYDRPHSPLGSGGDFYTAAHVDPLFAETLALRLRAYRRAAATSGPWSIVELGPGDGTLAAGIARTFVGDPRGPEYVLIDRSSARAREAEDRVRAAAPGVVVRRAESVSALGPFVGAVVANEVLDAQPARRLRAAHGGWEELGVRVTDEGVSEAVDGPARPVPGAPLPDPVDDGEVVEVSPLAEGIVREVADHLVDGPAIFLDFGLEQSELLSTHPHGTAAAVRDHRFLPDPYPVPGSSDLSVFVNFTRIRAAARAGGLAEVAYRSQAEALGAWGFEALRAEALRAAPNAEARVRRQLAMKNLLFGFERFRALEVAPPSTAARLASVT